MAQRQLRRATLGHASGVIVLLVLAAGACSDDAADSSATATDKGGATNSVAGRAGSAAGGSSTTKATGGSAVGTSGTTTTSSGAGTTSTGTAGQPNTSGGTPSSGGTDVGTSGAATTTGGSTAQAGTTGTSGAATGGAATGGAATGGAATGGAATGGAATGGAATGGAPPCAGINLQTDLANCGTCGHACAALPNMNVACVTGGCAYTCMTGFKDCNNSLTDGCEINLTNDPLNCGGCSLVDGSGGAAGSGNAPTAGSAGKAGAQSTGGTTGSAGASSAQSPYVCPSQNGTPICLNGTCQNPTCSSGWGNCDNKVETGCETQLISTTNCGTCGTSCARANATPSCALKPGICSIDTCNSGFGNCNNLDPDGCETSLRTATNCGTCGSACTAIPNATATCPSGTCAVSCASGFYDKDGLYSTGCECSSADSAAQTCAAGATSTVVPLDGTANITGNLVPGSTTDWYVVTFNGGDCNFNPQITLTPLVASDAIVFRVVSSCATNLGETCSEGGSSSDPSGYKSWDLGWGALAGGCLAANANSHPTVTYYVEVFTLASITSCGGYTLSLGN